MGDVSRGLSYDPTFDVRSPTTHLDKNASPGGRRLSDIHIPSPDHSVSVFSSEHFDKSGLVAAQEAALHDAAILEMGWTGGESDEYAFMPEGEKPKSPAIGSLQDLKSLRPIRLRNMKIGKVHRGRILSGTLCCKSVKIFAVMNVLEEEGTGDATKFVISNAVPRSATTATAQRLYPEGAQLSVREPYLKRFADGMVGILVENPNDVIFNYLPDEVPSPVSERENLLWPVYKEPAGDAPDTPAFNTYGSFLSSPSLLSRKSLDSPVTPRSPRSFFDDPMDGLNVRTIRKFRSFRKQDPGPDDHHDDGGVSPVKLSSGDEGLSSAVDTVGRAIREESFDELISTHDHAEAPQPGDLSADNLENGLKTEVSSKPLNDEGLESRVGQIGYSNGSISAGDPSVEELEHPSSPTRGLVSESRHLITNSTGISLAVSEQPGVSPDPSADNVHNAESAEELGARHGDDLEACVTLSENEKWQTGSMDREDPIESEKSLNSPRDRHNSQVGVDVQDIPAGQREFLLGIEDQEQKRTRAVGAPNTFQEEGVSCKVPDVEIAAAIPAELCSRTLSATGDGVEPSRPAGSDGVGKKGGVEIPVSESQWFLHENFPLPNGVKRGTAEVEHTDGTVAPVSSTTVASSPRANGNDKPERSLQMAAHVTEASYGPASELGGTEEVEGAQKDGKDSAPSTDSDSSASEGCRLSNEAQSDGGVDGGSHQTESLNSLSDLEFGKAVGSPIDSINVSDSSLTSGTHAEEVVSDGFKFPEIVDAVVDDELCASALRMKGNQRFARQDWTGSVELYTRAIHKALQESKEQMALSKCNGAHHVNGSGVETEMEIVMDYSNRAEAWLRLHLYERALADAERALSVDPNHLKSLFRKGRALLGLGDYQQALTHLESAYARAPFDRDLLAAIKLSRIGDRQSRLGIYELTDFYLRGRFAGEIPTCADYVGPVQVKAANGDKGRGLFLTRHVEAGDLLLVSNPLALFDTMCANKTRKSSLGSDAKGRFDPEVQEKLVDATRERAKVSTKNRRRLLALCYGEEGSEQPVPSMELFIPGRKVAHAENLNLEEERITRIVARNAIDRNMVSIPRDGRHDPPKGDAENHERFFWGLWVLPSFINHSCIPNVSLVVIGRALFVYASKDLSAGEELLCSYFNVFQPLPQRLEIASRCWGFTCKCHRCLLETRFESSLEKLYSLHSRVEPNPGFVLEFSRYGYKAPANDLAKELEVIEVTKKLDQRERCWLQASFIQLYTCSRDIMGPHGNYPDLEAALHAMQVVSPGSNSTLEVGLIVREIALKVSNGKKTTQYKAVNQQVLRICQCIYGKQKTGVLQFLMDGSRPDTTSKS